MHFRKQAMCVLAAAILAGYTCRQVRATELTIETQQGAVRGKTINDGQVKAFLGLPYATAPVGELRWKAPQPAVKWDGVRDATNYGAHCAQAHVFDDMIFQDKGPSEDCLFLNVYVPSGATKTSKLPVMFWIHGGGFAGGGGDEPRHNGDFLPLKDVVLVTINYRLGVFGFLASKELVDEGNGVAGNYGLLDMVAALQWVKQNVGVFGGDAGNITIFGESAGSMAISTLMASPMAAGLFQKAIGESGAVFGSLMAAEPLAPREKADSEWMATLGVKSLAEMRAMPADKILAAVKTRGMMGFLPVIDGKLLAAAASENYATGAQAHVPLLAGWNADEAAFLSYGMTVAKWKGMAAGLFGERSAAFLKFYPANTDQEAVRSATDYGSDSFIALSTWKWLEAHRLTGDSPVYRYHLELAASPSKYHPGTLAFHSDDIEYVFGTLDTRPGWQVRPEDRQLSEQMMSYWTNFAKTGDPNGPGLPAWPRYDRGLNVIHLDNTVKSGPDELRMRYMFLLEGFPAFHF